MVNYSLWRLDLFLVVCVLSHLAEVAVNAYICYWLWQMNLTLWLAVLIGLLVVPLLVLQLASYQLHSVRAITSGKRCELSVVLWHVVLLGLVWRYWRLAFTSGVTVTRQEVREIFILRVAHAFFSTMLVASLQTVVVLEYRGTPLADTHHIWPVMVAVIICVLSACWSVASYRKPQHVCCVAGAFAWTPVIFRLVWRLGEVCSRILAICLFTRCHQWWVLLVVVLHCISVAGLHVLENIQHQTKQVVWRDIFLAPYFSVFCHFNMREKRSKYGTVLYYVITILESAALVFLWIYSDTDGELHIPLSIIVCGMYMVGVVTAVLYYNFYHPKSPTPPSVAVIEGDSACLHQCINCRLNLCVPQDVKLYRPYLTTWVSVTDNTHPQYTDVFTASEDDSSNKRLPIRKLKKMQCKHGVPHGHDHLKRISSAREFEELAWDDYDLQIQDTGSGQEKPVCVDKRGRKVMYPIEPWLATGVHVDHGYYSGISSSSHEVPTSPGSPSSPGTSQTAVPHAGVDNIALQIDTSDDTAHDITTSSVTLSTVSSRAPMLSCGRCGHNNAVPVDDGSIFSTATSTSLSTLPQKGITSKKRRKDRRHGARHKSMPANFHNHANARRHTVSVTSYTASESVSTDWESLALDSEV